MKHRDPRPPQAARSSPKNLAPRTRNIIGNASLFFSSDSHGFSSASIPSGNDRTAIGLCSGNSNSIHSNIALNGGGSSLVINSTITPSQAFRARRRQSPASSALTNKRRNVLRRRQNEPFLCLHRQEADLSGSLQFPAHSKLAASNQVPQISAAQGNTAINANKLTLSPRSGYVSKELKLILRQWDSGNVAIRRSILSHFILEHRTETSSVIEASYANGGSLLLSRVMSSLRVARLSLSDQVIHFRGIQVFVASSSGSTYVSEFVEAGGIDIVLKTLRSIICMPNACSDVKRQDHPMPQVLSSVATDLCRVLLEIIRLIAAIGRPQKEMLCESKLLEDVSNLMRCVAKLVVGHDIRSLLIELGSGNPRYEDAVLYNVLQLLHSVNPMCQRMAAQTSRALMSSLSFHASQGVHDASMSFVPAAVSMTQSIDLQVQYEAAELLKVLAQDCPATLPLIISSLLALMKNPVVSPGPQEEDDEANVDESRLGHTKQAPATLENSDIMLCNATESHKDLLASANEWQASSARALESLLHLDGAPQILTEEHGVYAYLGALLNEFNVDVRDVALDVLRLLASSHESIGSITVGQVSSEAISTILGSEWEVLKNMPTTVGLVIEDLDAKKDLILRSSGWQTDAILTAGMEERLIINMKMCRFMSEPANSGNMSGLNRSPKVIQKRQKAKRQKKPAQVDPETAEQSDSIDYRPLMERLIRSSLPELMDRDFKTPARVALLTRKKTKQRNDSM